MEANNYQKYGKKWYEKNRESELLRAKEHYAKTGMSEAKRKHYMTYRYGVTEEQYLKMLNSQGGKCAICGTPPKDGKRFDIDHCHTTKTVRGLLCNNCNRGLGHFKDSKELLQNAIEYLATSPDTGAPAAFDGGRGFDYVLN